MLVDLDGDPDVAALIPTMGRHPDRLAACLRSLESQRSDLRIAIVCILNSSESELPALPAPLPATVTIERPGINLGWSGALSFGRSRTKAPLLWLVQDDMVVDDECLSELVAVLNDRPDLAMVAPIVVHDGVVPAGSCGGVLSEGIDTADFGMDHWLPAEDVPISELDLDDLTELDYVPSRGTLIRAGVWDAVGGMDPAYYPVQWADVDLCTAVRRAGYDFSLVRKATVEHAGMGSTPGYFAVFLGQLHRVRFAEKWFGGGVPVSIIDPGVATDLVGTVAVQATTKLSLLAAHVDQELKAAAAARAESARLRVELVRANEQLSGVLWSRSWRATAPLRRLGGAVRSVQRLRGKVDPSG